MIVANLDNEKTSEPSEHDTSMYMILNSQTSGIEPGKLNSLLAMDNLKYADEKEKIQKNILKEHNTDEISTADQNSLGKERSNETIKSENPCQVFSRGKLSLN